MPIRFCNKGTSNLSWSLAFEKTIGTALVATAESTDLSSAAPFTLFPSSGTLKPDHTQVVEVTFCPIYSNYEVISRLTLHTEGFGSHPIIVRGVGASSKLMIDKDCLDFGILRVGTRKSIKLSLKNYGILPTKYFLEACNQHFSADPEQGMIEGNGETEINVTFGPKNVGELDTVLTISPFSAASKKDILTIAIKGMGGYPEVSVLTKLVDFGTALFMTPNVKTIKIENKGSAEADLVFTSSHPNIRLKQVDKDGSIVMKPRCVQDFHLVYTPHVVEELNAKIFVRSSDSRGFESVIQAKGTVGVPKLVFEPPEVINGLLFGVSRIGKPVQKTLTLKNDGNIVLTYNITVKLVQETAVPIGDTFDIPAAYVSAATPFNVDPYIGTLNTGESQKIVVTFLPTHTKEYRHELVLMYDYQSKKIPLEGTGGQYLLRIDTPLKTLDFGVCRINRVFKKQLSIKNLGNLGFRYITRPEPSDKNWDVYKNPIQQESKEDTLASHQSVHSPQGDEATSLKVEDPIWVKEVSKLGYRLSSFDGFCDPYGRGDVTIEYAPTVDAASTMRLRIFYEEEYVDIDVQGRGAGPKLSMYDALTRQHVFKGTCPVIDIGVHPVNSNYGHIFQLVNDGAFGLDFFMQPMIMSEFDISPIRGFIEPHGSIPLTVRFRPTTESRYHATLKLMWEQESLKATIVGKGGLGRLGLKFANEDSAEKGLNYGMVPLNSSCEKRFSVNNIGMVAMSVMIDLSHDEFSLAQVSDPIQISQVEAMIMGTMISSKKIVLDWQPHIRLMLEPDMGVEMVARYTARSTSLSSANIVVKTEFDRIAIPVRGRGGTINLSHKGDASFGDIACNFTYYRKITIVNSGSISANIASELVVNGHSNVIDGNACIVNLTEVFTGLDPRSGWARHHLCREKGLELTAKLSGKEFWKLIALMVRKGLAKDEPVATSSGSKPNTARRSSVVGMLQLNNSHARLQTSSSSYGISSKKMTNAGASSHFKRRQMFYHLITTTQLTSQSVSRVKPFIRVDPNTCVLPSYGEIVLTLDLNISTEMALLATILIKSDIPNTPPYEIPIMASLKAVNIICDDTRILNFYRQPLGDSELISRTFSNVGRKDVSFKFINTNSGLTISPFKGMLKVGQTITVQFLFKPLDESIQTADIIFEPDCSQPIKLKMYGGGGYAKASLSRYRRFDFGHCMIGKDTISCLPILNEGNAILHLTKFELIETDTFFRGQDWPTTRISLFPGKSYNLPIMFNPHEESPSPGRLLVGTNTETFEIELVGLGREAVLIVSKVALEFSECLIGNSYEQRLGLKNIGDVNYPVTFKLEREFPDLEFVPSSMIITPFTENFVVISYTPAKETKTTVVLTISSPYSTHKVPLLLHAGTAILEFERNILDFGMFERTTRPSLTLSFKNTGTVRTSYMVKDPNRPSMFYIGQHKGILHPGKSAEVTITHTKHEVEEFEQKLVVRTDLIDKIYNVKVRGQCEETLVHPEEFSLLNLGVCPVLESTTKPLSFKNYGRFPLEYSIKASYPLKVVPATGLVNGNETETVQVTWSPSGGYELRTQISMVTNIGSFNIVIRGKATFPEIQVDNMYIDFGVCAAGYLYRQSFQVENRGKVPLKFNIPDPKESSYSVTTKEGNLQPKESAIVDVVFKPSGIGRFMSSLLVECKGIHYKEVALVGVGGILKFDIKPSSLDLGKFLLFC